MTRFLIAAIINIIIFLVVTSILAYFIHPLPEKEYFGFLKGVLGAFHGGWFLANWVYGFFDESRLLKAVLYEGWYNFFWWFGIISMNLYVLFNIVSVAFIKNEDE
jgi:hypothetical protein